MMMSRADAPGGRRRLLAVDDNRLIRTMIEDHFAAAGWDVEAVDGVAAARRALAAAVPDVIVSDIQMPGIDGWAFFEEVRRNARTASVPFVFLTVEGEPPQRLRGLQLGADDYMTKPFAVEELQARIDRVVKRQASAGAFLAGSVEHLAIGDLLQILALNGKTGTVELRRGDDDGRIQLDGGRIVDAAVGRARGTKALFRMLGWVDATFRVVAREGATPGPTISAPTTSLLMDAVVSLDEWARWSGRLPEASARLALTADASKQLSGKTLTPVECDLLARVKVGVTVASVIDDSPHPDAKVAEALCALLAAGVVRSAAAPSATESTVTR
jgi:DNA-binding response OmpR family regulator